MQIQGIYAALSTTDMQAAEHFYSLLFDREPDDAGFAHWTRLLASGRLSRGAFMVGLSESAEFKRITATS